MIALIMRSFRPSSAVLGLVAALAAFAWGPAARPSAAQDAPALVQAVAAARGWLDSGGAGPAVQDPDGVRSAAVVLRLHGRVLGLGKDAGDTGASGAVDRALRAAFADARGKAPSRPSAPADAVGLGRALTLELELARDRSPLIGRTFEEATRGLEPAECGLQLVDGDRTAYMPASFLLARNMASPMARGIVSLVRELGLPARDLPELQELGGRTALYACRGVRIVERQPGGELVVPCRLVAPVPMDAPPRAWLANACDRIVGRLERQLEVAPSGDGAPADAAAQVARTGLRGDYQLLADSYDPFTAGPADQALAAWALARAAATTGWPQSARDRCAATARRILAALAEVDASERDPASDPAAVACVTLAAEELGGSDELPPAFAGRIGTALAAQVAPAALTVARPHVRALLLDAAAARAGTASPPMPRERLDAEIALALASAPAAELPANAPFLFDALRRLHGGAWLVQVAEPSRTAADAARAVLVATQVSATRVGADGRPPLDDTIGAYPAVGSAAGRASAQSLRMHLFIAMLAGEDGTRGADRDAEDRRSLDDANRFLHQLLAPPSIACCAGAPDRATGGILASPADASQPLAAQAIAVLALCETERALDRLGGAAEGAGNGGNRGSAPER